MTTPDEFDVKKKLPSPWPHFGFAAFMVVVIWGIAFWKSSGDPDTRRILLILCGIATVLAPLFAWRSWHKQVVLARRGIRIMARIEKLGLSSLTERVVTLSYEFEGERYRKKTELFKTTLEGLDVGDELVIKVDQKEPKRISVEQ